MHDRDTYGMTPEELHDTLDPGATFVHVGPPDPEMCEYAGHEWAPAGGGLLICMQCEEEKWED